MILLKYNCFLLPWQQGKSEEVWFVFVGLLYHQIYYTIIVC